MGTGPSTHGIIDYEFFCQFQEDFDILWTKNIIPRVDYYDLFLKKLQKI